MQGVCQWHEISSVEVNITSYTAARSCWSLMLPNCNSWTFIIGGDAEFKAKRGDSCPQLFNSEGCWGCVEQAICIWAFYKQGNNVFYCWYRQGVVQAPLAITFSFPPSSCIGELSLSLCFFVWTLNRTLMVLFGSSSFLSHSMSELLEHVVLLKKGDYIFCLSSFTEISSLLKYVHGAFVIRLKILCLEC